MKKSQSNVEHRIQLKKDEIVRYEKTIRNYDTRKMERYGIPYLEKLRNELNIIKEE